MLKRSAYTIFIINAFIFFFQSLTKSVYAPLIVPFREAFMIDNAQAGLLVTLVFLGYAIARFPSGIMADKWSCTKVIWVGSLAMALSFWTVAVSPNYLSIAFFTFTLGVSSGLYVTAGYTLAVIIGKRKRAATATAAFESFGSVASIISPFLVTAFVLYFNWPWLFFLLGGLLLGLTLLFFRKKKESLSLEISPHNNMQEKHCENLNTATNSQGLKYLFKELTIPLLIFREPSLRRFIIWSTLIGGLGALSWTGINSFIPTFLVEDKGYSYAVANAMFAIIAVSGLVTKIGIGWLADRFGNRLVLFCILMLSVFLFFALTLANDHRHLLIILALLGVTCLNTNTLINSYVLRNMPEQYQGTGFGLFSTLYTVIYSFGPFLTGFLSLSLGLDRAFQLSSAGALVALILILLVSNSMRIDQSTKLHSA